MKNYELDKKCGERLAECMKIANINGSALAHKMNEYYEKNGLSATKTISQQKISTITTGRTHLKQEDAELFAMILDVDVNYLLGKTEHRTRIGESIERIKDKSDREQLYLQILELHGYELITTVPELKKVAKDPYFINQWIKKDENGKESISLYHVNYERARIFFLYDIKNRKISPTPILMTDFYKMIDDIDYHFKCSLERSFREYQEMIEYSIPLKGNSLF